MEGELKVEDNNEKIFEIPEDKNKQNIVIVEIGHDSTTMRTLREAIQSSCDDINIVSDIDFNGPPSTILPSLTIPEDEDFEEFINSGRQTGFSLKGIKYESNRASRRQKNIVPRNTFIPKNKMMNMRRGRG